MKKIRLKLIVLMLVIFSCLIYSVTVSAAEYLEKLRITSVEVIKLNIEETYTFIQDYESSDSSIFEIDHKVGTAKKEGTVYLTYPNKKEKKFIIKIEAYFDYIAINGNLMIDKGETSQLQAKVYPEVLDQSVIWKSSDESVATIDANGKVTAIDYGISTITAYSKNDNSCKGETIILVDDDSLASYEDIINNVEKDGKTEIVVDAANIKAVLKILVDQTAQSVVGIEKFAYNKRTFGTKTLESADFGSAVIYRRDAILTDGTVIQNIDDASKIENFKNYKYYVISSRHVVENAASLKIYLGEDQEEVDATLVQYDDKIDLSVVSFESIIFLPTIKLGNSDNIERGEFVIAIGNGYGKEYFRTATFGVISYTKRYAATDTDGDGTSDWDSEYIQHDASINSQTSSDTSLNSGGNGGALINLKGELIGINSTKISSVTVDNMSFATPTNTVMEIVSILETGEKINRPILGVTIIDVTTYYQNEAYYKQNYSDLNIPEGLEYGFYIQQVNDGGVAQLAGCKVGDIILSFNGVQTKYSYLLRGELGKFIIGSGQTAELVVLRDGEELTLTVTF